MGDGNLFHKFLRNAGLYLATKKPSRAQFELGQDWHFWTYALPLEFGELEFLGTCQPVLLIFTVDDERGQLEGVQDHKTLRLTDASKHFQQKTEPFRSEKEERRDIREKKLLTCKTPVLARHDDVQLQCRP